MPRQYVLKIRHNNLMPSFFDPALNIFAFNFFHHLALSEKDLSNHYRLNYAFAHWYHLYTDIMAEEHDDPA
jgi:hypothetical protein